MLLYTRLAPPKAPKKRSRAGCSYCKEKKKKCDEIRPSCARCQERGQPCVYEPVRPRQRRKREATVCSTIDDNSSSSSDRATYLRQGKGLDQLWNDQTHDILETPISELSFDLHLATTNPLDATTTPVVPALLSPVDTLATWSPGELPLVSPVDALDFQLPYLEDGTVSIRSGADNEDEIEEIVRSSPIMVANRTFTTSGPSLALIAPAAAPSPSFEFCSPAFAEFSDRSNRRALVDHFCNVLSHLIVFREERGNPFQQLVLPLCHNSPSVTNAVYALASAHLEYRGVSNCEKSVFFHNKAIQGLGKLIQQGTGVNRNELLAAIMLLIYYEVLVQNGRSNIVDGHLKGAMTIMTTNEAATDPTGIFLERAFRFYDVIAALSFGTAPLSNATGPSHLTPFPPLDSGGAPSSLSSVDTLLGMATSLWPIIHRLSNLLTVKDQLDSAVTHGELSKVAVLRTEFEITASAIESALKDWRPALPEDSLLSHEPEGLAAEQKTERKRLQSILNTAFAYRHSAFVYLYRTIYGYERSHPLVQRHTHISLTHCFGTVSNAGPMGALLWPLFVSACEATSLADRDHAQQVFVAIDRRQGMTNIDKAWRIVQEVWRRADEADLMQQREEAMIFGIRSGGDLWRKVSEDMGVTIVFG